MTDISKIIEAVESAPRTDSTISNATVFRIIEDAHADALISRIRELEEAAKWQPIETAPKDGTPVDLWFGDASGYREVNMVWRRTTPSFPDGCWMRDGGDWQTANNWHQNPSFWRRISLPSHPKDKA